MLTLRWSQKMTEFSQMRLVGFRSGVLVSEDVTDETVNDKRQELVAQGFTVWVTHEPFPGIREYHCAGYMLNKASQ